MLGIFILVLGMATESVAQQPAHSIPHLSRDENTFHLYVDEKPFLMLSGQVHNSSATTPADMKAAMDSVLAIHGNTVEVPVYWELVEPEQGKFDFHLVDDILVQARNHNLRVVLLWFGTWKNAWMTYTPEWVKRDTKQFQRAVDASGNEMGSISTFSEAARNADAHAFHELMKYLRGKDSVQQTVILVQVENETGYLQTDRDHSAAANSAYEQAPPVELLKYIETHLQTLSPALSAAWHGSSQTKSKRNWHDYFGVLAPEVFSAWFVATYLDRVAEAGKDAYPLPMYANDWLMGPDNERAGRWPSGGPTGNVIDVWKAAAPHLDLVAPDVYLSDFVGNITPYARKDNALFIPEVNADMHWAGNVFPAMAEFNAIGFSPFGIDDWFEEGKLKPTAQVFANNYQILGPILPMIAKEQGTGSLHGFVQDQANGKIIRLRKTEGTVAVVEYAKLYEARGALGAGLILELGPEEFIVAGSNIEVSFRAMEGPLRDRIPLTIEDGTYNGVRWVTIRRLNGDEFNTRLPEGGGIRRVRLLE